MNTTSSLLRFLALFCAILAISFLSGCQITSGKAKEAHLTIGWPGVLAFEKHETGVSFSESGTLKAADTSTKFSVLLLTWESRGKDVLIKFKDDGK
jgi:hypothetical protein